jgi:RecB family exonuclease
MKIELPQFADGHVLTHSAEAKFKSCCRKYFLAYRLGLRTAHDSEPLRIGSMFHLGVGIYESGIPIDDAIEAVRQAYADTECPPYLDQNAYDAEKETAIALIIGHHRRWKDDGILETVAIEIPFELSIVNPDTGRITPRYVSGGKIDRIARLPDGRLALVERKTVGESIEPQSDYWLKLLMDSQISRYMLAARRLGYDVQTTVYDVVRKPAIRPKDITKSDRAVATSTKRYFDYELSDVCPERETPAMYAARLIDDMNRRPDFYFARVEIPRTENDLREFQAEQWTIKSQIGQCEANTARWGSAAWPRNTAACTGFGSCEYLNVCRGTTGNQTEQIPAGFRRVERIHQELGDSLKGAVA